MFKNKWTYLAWVSAWVFAGNLASRGIFWPEKALLSWNIPICVALILIIWPIGWYLQVKLRKRIEHWQQMRDELESIKAGVINTRISDETWTRIDEFLKHPEIGVKRERPVRKPSDHNQES